MLRDFFAQPASLWLFSAAFFLSSCQKKSLEAEGRTPSLPSHAAESAPPEPAAGGGAEPFAVLELFTSEGCSSCPPADRNLTRVAERARATGARVYALSLHVDYWNRLGWKDPFSSPIHSRRQQDYAQVLAGGRVYTPQLVVNGSEELVGSDASGTDRALERALGEPAEAEIDLSAVTRAPERRISVRYAVSYPEAARLVLLLVQDHAESQVSAGENHGRTLSHSDVVRELTELSVEANAHGTWAPVLPEGLSPDHAFVVGFLADPRQKSILGAERAAIAAR